MAGALREILAIFSTEVDDSGLKKGEKSVASFRETLGEFGSTLANAFAVKRIVQFGSEILEQADALAKQSQALSVSAASLQGWQWAADLSGSSAEEFNGAFTKFNRNVAAAAAGTGPAAEALKAFGISAEDIKNKAPIDLLDDLAAGLENVQDPAKRTEAFMALFGKSGAKLLPLFLEGEEGIRKLRAEVDALGFSFDEAFLADAQEVNDNVDRTRKGIMGIGVQAIKPLLPMLVEWSQRSVEVVKQLVELVKTSNASKAALVSFGVYAVTKTATGLVQLAQKAGFLKNGLRGLFLQLLPLTLAFLVLEDAWTFFTGGESETEGLINRLFGPDAAAKVKFFADTLKNDVGPVLSDIFAIFTDGKPLDEKLRQLNAYINGTLKPQFKTDFGEMAEAAMQIVKAIEKIAEAVMALKSAADWMASLKGPGDLLFPVADAALNDNAHNAAIARDKPGRAPSASDFDTSKKPLLQQAIAFITGFKDSDAVPIRLGGASKALDPQQVMAQQNVASVPLPFGGPTPPPEVHQSIVQNVAQHFTAETPAEMKRATRDGAKEGLTEAGEYLRTKRALVPSP